jgi:hypothetical protein
MRFVPSNRAPTDGSVAPSSQGAAMHSGLNSPMRATSVTSSRAAIGSHPTSIEPDTRNAPNSASLTANGRPVVVFAPPRNTDFNTDTDQPAFTPIRVTDPTPPSDIGCTFRIGLGASRSSRFSAP